ncbi:hypothetical protein Asulf_00948 [Archaeoglobus sulfaticallidus PM70-1]|uniref:Uncharacterized protein n=1 Tax=Archaeoglobus sulfaticallidus PM70-1 TaxID=387631 RepID=N0BFB5_9EURY|nr:hypothetical protein Asulf_00948 [Archaeoglobus sulfaticallidus PM70-1]
MRLKEGINKDLEGKGLMYKLAYFANLKFVWRILDAFKQN